MVLLDQYRTQLNKKDEKSAALSNPPMMFNDETTAAFIPQASDS
jgi:hypothetical protein